MWLLSRKHKRATMQGLFLLEIRNWFSDLCIVQLFIHLLQKGKAGKWPNPFVSGPAAPRSCQWTLLFFPSCNPTSCSWYCHHALQWNLNGTEDVGGGDKCGGRAGQVRPLSLKFPTPAIGRQWKPQPGFPLPNSGPKPSDMQYPRPPRHSCPTIKISGTVWLVISGQSQWVILEHLIYILNF